MSWNLDELAPNYCLDENSLGLLMQCFAKLAPVSNQTEPATMIDAISDNFYIK